MASIELVGQAISIQLRLMEPVVADQHALGGYRAAGDDEAKR